MTTADIIGDCYDPVIIYLLKQFLIVSQYSNLRRQRFVGATPILRKNKNKTPMYATAVNPFLSDLINFFSPAVGPPILN